MPDETKLKGILVFVDAAETPMMEVLINIGMIDEVNLDFADLGLCVHQSTRRSRACPLQQSSVHLTPRSASKMTSNAKGVMWLKLVRMAGFTHKTISSMDNAVKLKYMSKTVISCIPIV